MKRVLFIVTLILFSAASYAQFNKVSYDTPCAAKLVQIDQYDESTVFFFTITAPEERQRFVVNDNIKVVVDGAYKACRLISTGNIPMSSENCVAYLKEKGNTLNFTLEFEKVPLDKPFSIIENPERNTPLTFNFNNISVDAASTAGKIDIDDFLSFTDYVKSGLFSKDGKNYMYYEVNGLMVATHLGEEYSGFTKMGILSIEVVNESGKPVNFSSANIQITAMKNEKKGYLEIPVWPVSTYDDAVRDSNYLNMQAHEEEVNPIASSIGRYRRNRVKIDDVGSQVVLGTLETIFRSTTREEMDEYAAALEEYRQKKWDNYLQDARLDNGEYYGGFVAFKDSNYKHYIININLGGHVYTFHING